MSGPGLEILRAADLRPVPWKNGGGTTTEIAAHPHGASLDAFDWRVSTAQVVRDGPFSAFPGIDRTLAVVSGRGLVLRIAGHTPTTLSAGTAPLAFPGDAPTEARLPAGPITDLNVMTRRSVFRHAVLPIARPSEHRFAADVRSAVLVSLGGPTNLEGPAEGAGVRLADGDGAVIEGAAGHRIRIAPLGAARAWLVLLHAAAPQTGCG